MTDIIAAVILLLLALGFVVLRKTYNYVPVREMKRRAAKHDPLASKLYPAVAYGGSLRELLLVCVVLSTGGGFVLLTRAVPSWIALLAVFVVLWIAFMWLPNSRVTSLSARFTVLITPMLIWVLNVLYPILYRSAGVIEKYRASTTHTGLFDRSDLLRLIEQQELQEDNRLSSEELEIVKRTLLFNELQVADCSTPLKQKKTILGSDILGPVLINEIHESGQDIILVRESPRGNIIGTLAFKSLDLKTTGSVRSVMDPRIYYLHEDDTLTEALHAFFTTNCSLFVVTNTAEEDVGIITIEDILRALLGHIPGNDFDQYADRSAVAGRHHKKQKSEPGDEEIVHNSEEVVE